MKKFISLLKAMLSQDMNLFKYKTKTSSSKISKILLPVFLALVIMLAVGSYCLMLAEPLAQMGLTYIILSLFMFVVTILAFMEGIYKSQGILFDSKDNDLLFSLPIKKSTIFALRIIKLLIFQFLYNMLFILPSIVIYAFFEKPGFDFYLLTTLMVVLLPIIPTIVASILGYIVKGLSSKFKAKKIVQTLFSLVLFLGIMYLSFNLQNFINKLIENATTTNEVITKIYYPIGIYIGLIQKFNIVELLKLIVINIIPFVAIVYIGSIYYFKIISKSNETSITSNNRVTKKYRGRKPLSALIKKELTRYFSSTIYMFNTLFGGLLMLVATIGLCINANAVIQGVLATEGLEIDIQTIHMYLPKIFIQFIIFVGCMTSITSSSISLEGKSFNITKSLPVSTDKILLAKVITSNIITLPLMLISDIIFAIKFNLSLINVLLIIGYTFAIPIFSSIVGLIVNLKYPKMEWSSDTEVVKQSMATMISIWIGMIVFGITTALMFKFNNNLNIFATTGLIVFVALDIALYCILKIYGRKKFSKINV